MEDIRHKSEITLEDVFCWNIKEGFVLEQKMVIKVETDEQDMSKGQQKRPRLTGSDLEKNIQPCADCWESGSHP